MRAAGAISLVSLASAQDLFLAGKPTASVADLARARTRKQGGSLAGSNPREIADKINQHLSSVASQKACEEFALEDLNNVVRVLFPHLSEELSGIYQGDDGRSRRFKTLAEYERAWEKDGEHDFETLRDAKCAEALMLWAHHLSESGKARFKHQLPTLPTYDAAKGSSPIYAESLSCQTGHMMTAGGDGSSSHEWPDWPEEIHYKAMGHGAYPFWWTQSFTDEDGSAPMEVWYSEKQGVEKFYHTSCSGSFAWLDGSACYHMMFAPVSGKYTSYMYNEAAAQGKTYADGARCCLTNPSSGGFGPSENLGPSQSNFWNTFTYKGEVDFNGVYYQGKAKYYVMTGVSEPVREFWYFTDLDGKPVQQGEAGTGPTDQGYPTSIGHTIWHDYDQSTFDLSPIDPSTFEVPAYCQATTTACAFP
jgi:hypothetical protein